MNDWKVWKINDYEWLAGIDFKSAKEWYLKESGFDDVRDEPIYNVQECNLSQDTMWWDYDSLPNSFKRHGLERKFIGGDLVVRITFQDALTILQPKDPFIIATSEW